MKTPEEFAIEWFGEEHIKECPNYDDTGPGEFIAYLKTYGKQIRKQTIEECAKVCEEYSESCDMVMNIRLSQDRQGILDYPEEMHRLDQGSVDGAIYCAESISGLK